MARGRRPAEITESAKLVHSALQILTDRTLHTHWVGVAPPTRFTRKEILAEVEASLLATGAGDNEQRRYYRAKETTRAGTAWLLDHGRLVRESDGRLGLTTDVASALLEAERTLASVRLVLQDMQEDARRREQDFGRQVYNRWEWPTEEKQRHYAKVMLGRLMVRAEHRLDSIAVPGWDAELSTPITLLDEFRAAQERGAAADVGPPTLENQQISIGTGVNIGEFWGSTSLDRSRFERLMRALGLSETQIALGWAHVRAYRKERPGGWARAGAGSAGRPSSHSIEPRTPSRRRASSKPLPRRRPSRPSARTGPKRPAS